MALCLPGPGLVAFGRERVSKCQRETGYFSRKGQKLIPRISSVCPDSGEPGNLRDATVRKKEGRQAGFLETLALERTYAIQKACTSAALEDACDSH